MRKVKFATDKIDNKLLNKVCQSFDFHYFTDDEDFP